MQQGAQHQPGKVRANRLKHRLAVLTDPLVHLRKPSGEGTGTGSFIETPLFQHLSAGFITDERHHACRFLVLLRGWGRLAVHPGGSIIPEGTLNNDLIKRVSPLLPVKEADITVPQGSVTARNTGGQKRAIGNPTEFSQVGAAFRRLRGVVGEDVYGVKHRLKVNWHGPGGQGDQVLGVHIFALQCVEQTR